MRSIIDRFDLNKRKNIIKNHLKNYIPERLFNLLSSEDLKDELEELPFSFIDDNSKQYIVSNYSEIAIDIEKKPNNEYFKI